MSAFQPQIPYNSLPQLPPDGIELQNDLALAKLLIDARSALAELSGISQSLPNPALLLDLVTLREGQASSAIENLVTTQDELYRAIAEGRLFATPKHNSAREGDPVKEVLRYREAMYKGWELLKKRSIVNTTLCTAIVQEVKGQSIGVRNSEGTRIAKANGDVIYTPPVGEARIRTMLKDWEEYINLNYQDLDHDPLIALALSHYQFEAIHPFPDGNGRTGRIINVLHLVNAGLLPSPILYLSGYINQNRKAYYRGLRAVTENSAWKEWVMFIVRGISVTAKQTIKDIRTIRSQMDVALNEIREALGDNMPAERIRDLAFQNAYIKISNLDREGIAKRQTASKYLHALTREGGGPDFLRPERRGREVYFRNHRLLELLSQGE
jgi:Fic family protein